MKRLILILSLALPAFAQAPQTPAGRGGGGGGGRGGASQTTPAPAPAEPAPAAQPNQSTDEVLKGIDDLEWRIKIGDIADFDKIAYASLPPAHNPNPTGPGAGNPMIVYGYTFIPKKLDRSKKQPLIVLIHGGVHSNFTSDSAHIVREFL